MAGTAMTMTCAAMTMCDGHRFPSLRAKRSNPGVQDVPWIAAGLAALAMTPGTAQY